MMAGNVVVQSTERSHVVDTAKHVQTSFQRASYSKQYHRLWKLGLYDLSHQHHLVLYVS